MNNAIATGTYNQVEILAPFTTLSKCEIVLLGKKLNVPFEQTYSCYTGKDIHCGVCATCIERKEALEGFDLTEYLV